MTEITSTHLCPVPRRTPMVVAVFSFRFDEALVPALIANISPMVHGYVACDDRGSDKALSDEPGRRNRLHAAARAMGADWILAVDPDERFEAELAHRIGDLTTEKDGRTFWVFNLREMLSTTAYRADGLWGRKTQMRLYPASATLTPLSRALHGNWVNPDPAYSNAQTGINLYHLRHATSERMRHRRDTYASADPERRFQIFGYDYLMDMRGSRLTEIRPDRNFYPPHLEDGGLWASPDSGAIGNPDPDPLSARLNLMSVFRHHRGADGAAYVAEDIWHDVPEDTDMLMVAASMALRAGRPLDVLRLIHAAEKAPLPVFADVISARAHTALGEKAKAVAAMAHAVDQVGPSQILSHMQLEVDPDRQDFMGTEAGWRRWTKDGGRIHEGPRNGAGKLTVIVIGFRSPATLASAVGSVRIQSPEVEIVVVNSGGGNARGVLHAHLDHIRLIETETSLFVGAARNIGIESSRAPYVAFLASDCIALPGWVEARLARHEAGALMVSTAVVPSRPGTITGTVAEHLVYSRRAPSCSEDDASHYGRSYHRTVFAEAGLFAPRLRIGEDSELHRRTDSLAEPVWAPEIQVQHGDPQSFIRLLIDLRRRAQRAAIHQRPTNEPETGRGSEWVKRQIKVRQDQIKLSLRRDPRFGSVRKFQLRLALRLGLMAYEQGLRHADKRLSGAHIAAKSARTCSPDELGKAITLAREAVSSAPQSFTFRILLGNLLQKRNTPKDTSAALAQMREAHAISPTAVQALKSAAATLHRLGRTGGALNLCEHAVISTPGHCSVLLVAAQAAVWGEKPQLALYLAQRALAADPASADAHEFLEKMHRVSERLTLAERRKDMAKCLRDAKSALLPSIEKIPSARATK